MAERFANDDADLAMLDTNIDLLASDRQPLGDICAGCVELTQRVEQLEQRLLQLDSPARTALGTTLCYWLCVGFHALLCFGSFASDTTVSFAYVFVIGGCGTLAVCHVLATRTLITKMARSALSIFIVTFAVALSTWLSDQNDPMETLQITALYLPMMVFGGWIVAKTFVWAGGWRIIPPGGSREFCKPTIADLMMITFAAAFMFGSFRFAIGDVADELASEWLSFLIYIAAPVGTASMFTVLLARVILTSRASVSVPHLIIVILAGIGSVIFLYALLSGIDGDFEFSHLPSLISYCVMSTLFAAVSPLVTFALMRSAGYRFTGRG